MRNGTDDRVRQQGTLNETRDSDSIVTINFRGKKIRKKYHVS
jgi:hypothetical protein